ncbi:hypothetical protein ACR6HW_09150 [Fusibacter sp. JL298sf-3]
MKRILTLYLIIAALLIMTFYNLGKQSRIDAYHDLHVTQYEEQLDTVLLKLKQLKAAVATGAPIAATYMIQCRGELVQLGFTIEYFSPEVNFNTLSPLSFQFIYYNQLLLEEQLSNTPDKRAIEDMIHNFSALKKAHIFATESGDFQTIRERWNAALKQFILNTSPDIFRL